MRRFFLSILVLLPQLSLANDIGCMPENQLRYPAFEKSNSKINKAQYLRLLKKVKEEFSGLVKKKFNKILMLEDQWEEPRVNAYCTRDLEDNPIIKVMGGMARHPEMTPDGLTLIICHELGHYLGGAPKALRGNTNKKSWSSIEGQADYFATSKCLPLLFQKENNKDIVKSIPSQEYLKAKKRCGKQDPLCIRMAMAALSATKVFHSLKEFEDYPDLLKKDESLAYETEMGHPSAQCRLDTYINGGSCMDKVTVMFDPVNPLIGSCLTPQARRPLCWYNPSQI